MDKQLVFTAINELTISMTKLAQVIHDQLNDPLIHEKNTPRKPSAPASISPDKQEGNVDLLDEEVELDDEQRPWVEGVHAGSRGLVNSKNIKGGKAWRLAKGADKELVQKFYEDYPLDDENEEVSLPGKPSKPAAKKPGAPSKPGKPSAPKEVDENAELRKSLICTLQSLINEFNLSWDDLKEILVDEFDVAQNGEEVTLGGVPTEMYEDIDNYFIGLSDLYADSQKLIDELYATGGKENKDYVDENLTAYYEYFDAEDLGGVGYKNVVEFSKLLSDWLTEWKAD